MDSFEFCYGCYNWWDNCDCVFSYDDFGERIGPELPDNDNDDDDKDDDDMDEDGLGTPIGGGRPGASHVTPSPGDQPAGLATVGVPGAPVGAKPPVAANADVPETVEMQHLMNELNRPSVIAHLKANNDPAPLPPTHVPLPDDPQVFVQPPNFQGGTNSGDPFAIISKPKRKHDSISVKHKPTQLFPLPTAPASKPAPKAPARVTKPVKTTTGAVNVGSTLADRPPAVKHVVDAPFYPNSKHHKATDIIPTVDPVLDSDGNAVMNPSLIGVNPDPVNTNVAPDIPPTPYDDNVPPQTKPSPQVLINPGGALVQCFPNPGVTYFHAHGFPTIQANQDTLRNPPFDGSANPIDWYELWYDGPFTDFWNGLTNAEKRYFNQVALCVTSYVDDAPMDLLRTKYSDGTTTYQFSKLGTDGQYNTYDLDFIPNWDMYNHPEKYFIQPNPKVPTRWSYGFFRGNGRSCYKLPYTVYTEPITWPDDYREEALDINYMEPPEYIPIPVYTVPPPNDVPAIPDPPVPLPVDPTPLPLLEQSTFRMSNVWDNWAHVQADSTDTKYRLICEVSRQDGNALAYADTQTPIWSFADKAVSIYVPKDYPNAGTALSTKLGVWYYRRPTDSGTLEVQIDVTSCIGVVDSFKVSNVVYGYSVVGTKKIVKVPISIPFGVGAISFDVQAMGPQRPVLVAIRIPYLVKQVAPIDPWKTKASGYWDHMQDSKWLPDGVYPSRTSESTVQWLGPSNPGAIVQRTDKMFGHTVLLRAHVKGTTLTSCDPGTSNYGTVVKSYSSNGTLTGAAASIWSMFMAMPVAASAYGLQLERNAGNFGYVWGFLWDEPPVVVPSTEPAYLFVPVSGYDFNQSGGIGGSSSLTDVMTSVENFTLTYQYIYRLYSAQYYPITADLLTIKDLKVLNSRTNGLAYTSPINGDGVAVPIDRCSVLAPAGYANVGLGRTTRVAFPYHRKAADNGRATIIFDLTSFYPRIKGAIVSGGYTYQAFQSGSSIVLNIRTVTPVGYGICYVDIALYGDEYPLMSDCLIPVKIYLSARVGGPDSLITSAITVNNSGTRYLLGGGNTIVAPVFNTDTTVSMWKNPTVEHVHIASWNPFYAIMMRGSLTVSSIKDMFPNGGNYGLTIDTQLISGVPDDYAGNYWSFFVVPPLSVSYVQSGVRIKFGPLADTVYSFVYSIIY
jgi:hypothetical protein